MDALRSDVRFAFRSLRATPIVPAVAVCSLPLGIGANAADRSRHRPPNLVT
jgi:hypothetical protein